MTRQAHITSFLERSGYGSAELFPLAGDASFRRYIRLSKNGQSYMLMDAPPEKENVRPYMAIADFLTTQGYSAPRIIAKDEVAGFLLLEDLGDDTFSRILRHDLAVEKSLYHAAIDVLAQWHQADHSQHISLPLYDHALLMREIALFSDWFLPQCVGIEQAARLGEEYKQLWQAILADAPLSTAHFVHRDYHADNLMWLPQRPVLQQVGLLDFQDGVFGDAAYDVVSLLEDARRDVDEALAQEMLAHYIQQTGCDESRFRTAYAMLGAQRACKVIGIFTRLAARDGKAHYLAFLPRVWAHLERDLLHPSLSDLRQWLDKTIASEWRGNIAIAHDANALRLSA